MADFAYLDHAATAAIRPPSVVHAVAHYLSDIGATPGRGGHRLALAAGRVALQCRQRIAQLFGIPGDSGRITFAANATHALNAALWGAVRRGDRIVVTAFDHNAVLRPAAALARERAADVVLVPGSPDGELDEAALQRALDGARVFCINGASNVLGTRLNVTRLAALARAAGALSIVDVAQLAGHVPIDAAAWHADMIAFTGHKGMLGPQGIGGLWVRAGVELVPLVTGGTGGDSLLRDMPAALPDQLEAGTLNGPGIAGLAAGIDVVMAEGVPAMHARTAALKRRLWEGMSALDGVHVHSPPAPAGVPIVTITADSVDPATLAARLDREFGVLTRAGLHCAPEAHRMMGTAATGAVRFSLGWSSTGSDVERALAAMQHIVAARRP
ncbi:MAG TPA: aminotransferase class V-fold PLP-dependent enzyme [Longimicrobiales bacterium]|nr:aminotransferase class V-fold PLP-dependent enzyme [Longimicrobiales bacterium]